MKYDLMIRFNENSFIDLRNSETFKELANWKKFGTKGFRGFCTLDKEDIEKLLIETFKLDSKDFQVVKATGLYVPN